MTQADLEIKNLGPCRFRSLLEFPNSNGDSAVNFVGEDDQLLFNISWEEIRHRQSEGLEPLTMERAGPREYLFYNPPDTTAAIVTCGGLCPGINTVIRSLVMTLYYRYRVKDILGVRYGFRGFNPANRHDPMRLSPKTVSNIHQFGGTMLGSSRGKQETGMIVDWLERNGVDMLFTIGGDGTLRGAMEIVREIERRQLEIAVAGIPKTIDNDIDHLDRTFGFETSFTIASPIIGDAHNEARGAYNGVAIVKLMGRESGFIAANAALAMPEVNLVLVPEQPFDLYGEKGMLAYVGSRLKESEHCLIVVAEGAGQHLFGEGERKTDASGNIRLNDIGVLLKDTITRHFEEKGMDITVKYIDPSYIIRSAPAVPSDSLFCNKLALNAVHGAMAGKTGFVVGRRNRQFVYLPMALLTHKRKQIDIAGDLWMSVLDTTGQPVDMLND